MLPQLHGLSVSTDRRICTELNCSSSIEFICVGRHARSLRLSAGACGNKFGCFAVSPPAAVASRATQFHISANRWYVCQMTSLATDGNWFLASCTWSKRYSSLVLLVKLWMLIWGQQLTSWRNNSAVTANERSHCDRISLYSWELIRGIVHGSPERKSSGNKVKLYVRTYKHRVQLYIHGMFHSIATADIQFEVVTVLVFMIRKGQFVTWPNLTHSYQNLLCSIRSARRFSFSWVPSHYQFKEVKKVGELAVTATQHNN